MNEKLSANQYRLAVLGISLLFGAVAIIGAVHSFLRGYSEIYTSIFILLAGGYGLIVYILIQINRTN